MEGKDINDLEIEVKNITPKAQNISGKLDAVLSDFTQEPKETLAELLELIKLHNVSGEMINKWTRAAGVESIADLGIERQIACVEYINKHYNYSQRIEAA